jgi:TRAP-type C4-dicarboxylate transport system permease small subunit
MGLLSRFGHIFDKFNNGLIYFNGVLIISIMVLVTLDIILRNVINFPIEYLDEFSGYSIVYMCFLGAAWVLRRDGHVSVDIVIDHLSARSRTIQKIVISILLAMMCLFLTYFGAGATYDVYTRGKYIDIGINVPVYPFLGVMPLGYFLLFIQFLRRICGVWKLGADAYKNVAKEEELETIKRL